MFIFYNKFGLYFISDGGGGGTSIDGKGMLISYKLEEMDFV